MQTLLANIRGASRIARNFLKQSFELPLANIFQIRAFRPLRCSLIKINRDAKTFPNLAAYFSGQRDAILDGHAFDRDERNHISSAHARMRARVFRQIDQLGSFAYSAQSSFGHSFWLACESHYAAVMIAVAF